jgi:hypothetical protein
MMAGTMSQPEAPNLNYIKQLLIGEMLRYGRPPIEPVVKGLLDAYIGLFDTLHRGQEKIELAYDDGEDFEARELYQRFAVAGYRTVCPSEDLDDDEVYKLCTTYELGRIFWPEQLLAEVAYLRGALDARSKENP